MDHAGRASQRTAQARRAASIGLGRSEAAETRMGANYGGTMRRFYFLAKSAAMAFLAGLLAPGVCIAQQPTENLCPFLPATPATPGHPHPQPRPQASEASVTQEDGITLLRVKTAH